MKKLLSRNKKLLNFTEAVSACIGRMVTVKEAKRLIINLSPCTLYGEHLGQHFDIEVFVCEDGTKACVATKNGGIIDDDFMYDFSHDVFFGRDGEVKIY
jgi:hypothetical protein